MLLEGHHHFVMANEKNLDQLRTIIVPSHNGLTAQQAGLLNAWMQRGVSCWCWERERWTKPAKNSSWLLARTTWASRRLTLILR